MLSYQGRQHIAGKPLLPGECRSAKGTRLAAETLATTAVELFQSPKLIADAKAEFNQARGGSFSYSALIGDRDPPLDYRVTN
jgi:aminobenzoyl-glutamate utilization protein B